MEPADVCIQGLLPCTTAAAAAVGGYNVVLRGAGLVVDTHRQNAASRPYPMGHTAVPNRLVEGLQDRPCSGSP